jgi:predicted RNA-binding protein YlxR (DUF448 family)
MLGVIHIAASPRTLAEAARARKDIVSGEVMEEARLIRFVLSPDGAVTPDLGRKLPGRGMWVEAKREAVDMAVKRGLFSRAAKAKVTAPPDLADQVDQGWRPYLGIREGRLSAGVRSRRLDGGGRRRRPGWPTQAHEHRQACAKAATAARRLHGGGFEFGFGGRTCGTLRLPCGARRWKLDARRRAIIRFSPAPS